MYFRLFFFVMILLQQSCGFRSVYSENNSSSSNKDIESIEVIELNSLEGSEFRYYLSKIMPKKRETKYLLKVDFGNSTLPILIKKDSNLLRNGINQTVNYQLSDVKDNKIISSGSFRQLASYNITFAPYASYIEEEATLTNLTKKSAEEIRNRLILYFEKKDNSK